MKETLPQRLVRFRDERGLSQDQAAELAGISRVSITRYENGTREPKYKNLLAIAKAYGLTLEELTGEEKPIPEDELDKKLIQMLSIALSMPNRTVQHADELIDFFQHRFHMNLADHPNDLSLVIHLLHLLQR